MRHNTTETLNDYFNRIRKQDAAPLRADVNPAEIQRILPDVFMLEAVDNMIFRFRLAGTRFCANMGQEARGQDFAQFWTLEDRRRITLAMQTVLAGRLPQLHSARDIHSDETVELSLFPLRSRADLCDRIIGALARADQNRPLRVGMELALQSTHALGGVSTRAPVIAPLPRPDLIVRSRGIQFRVFDGGRT